ncbi:hypothetical protein AAVH_16222 [Aphelenchoides avenae]|nr:hypothetical protein AAVH_16222 [Aphelenchus avenae]
MILTALTVCLAASLAQLTAGTSLRYSSEGYTLNFYDQTSGQSFNRTTQDRMVDAFFTVYPPMRETYNTGARTTVNFYIDPKYKDVAATRSDGIHFNPSYLANNPEDIDTVTHEAYPATGGQPGWAVEGIADYVRHKLGVNNDAAGWSLPEYDSSQNYTNSYGVSARFFLWIEYWYYPSFVQEYDAALRGGTWSDFFEQTLGYSVDEMWAEYASYPDM